MTHGTETPTPESALTFRNAFREARLKVLENAENYQELLFVLERLGTHLAGPAICSVKDVGLAAAKPCIMELVKHGALRRERPAASGTGELCAGELYDLVRNARNDAMHEGAFARNLAVHLVQLGVMLEDALVNKADGRKAKHYMMREPITAEPWEPIAFVRQKMLVHSFSHLPVRIDGSWKIVSDHGIAVYLWQPGDGACVKEKLQQQLDCAVKEGTLKVRCAVVVKPEDVMREVVQDRERYIREGYPILVKADIKDESENPLLVGILTPFDLLYAPRFQVKQA